MRWVGRVAVVTGAAQGIGAATARRLAADGATVAILDVLAKSAADTAATIEATGGRALPVFADVTREDSVREAIQLVESRLGPVDILVNNAGIVRYQETVSMAIADWDAMLAVNLRGPFVCARAVIPGMVDRRYGKIVNVASIAAYGAVTPGQSHYAAAKAGVIGLTKTLAYELGPHNVNVNAVAPGVVHSEMLERAARSVGMDYDEFCGQRAAGVALRRLGKPEDVANAIAFLASDEAAYIHGEVIHVTGGPVRGA